MKASTLKPALAAALLGLSLASPLSLTTAAAHGPEKAEHGGVVRVASDLSFELVRGTDKTALYIVDHGKPVDTAGLSGKLTVLAERDRIDHALTPAGGNKLEAATVLPANARVVATVTLANGKVLAVRFSVK